ncbi:MAG: TetR/AcrR family transcriptional regulator [Alphaproteobacteria bacterium]|nr:TetR/AcrR family transcriptional regulator [Alphaproteobacteria bacterium]MBL6936361.1 TetR/AcrR family transcriptional regulator [Alphaproteobacteria bacterium]MBL7098588.1 TetR/AcrR family transcriptional regulator [Alphaproteobacteria bacterium]
MSRAKAAVKKRAYHHGDLRDQLVAAAEAIILERGVEGFTLREAARRAGVSPAAPAHHFKDAKGLLGEVALRGFRDFGEALDAGDRRGGDDPYRRLMEQGNAYVNFALKHPARFQLMFAHGKYDITYPGLAETGDKAFRVLERAVRAAYAANPGDDLSPDAYGYLMAVWSIVHGFAHLTLGGEFDWAARQRGGGKDTILKHFLPLTLKHLPLPSR